MKMHFSDRMGGKPLCGNKRSYYTTNIRSAVECKRCEGKLEKRDAKRNAKQGLGGMLAELRAANPTTQGERHELIERGFRTLVEQLGAKWVTCGLIRNRADHAIVLALELATAGDAEKLEPWFNRAGLPLGEATKTDDGTIAFEVVLLKGAA